VNPDIDPVLGFEELTVFAWIRVGKKRFAAFLQSPNQLFRLVRRQSWIGGSVLNQQGRLDPRHIGNDVGLPIGFGLLFGRAAHFNFPADFGIAIGPLQKGCAIDGTAEGDTRRP
jgi:hypothetical protein